jgi:hypothetical protein
LPAGARPGSQRRAQHPGAGRGARHGSGMTLPGFTLEVPGFSRGESSRIAKAGHLTAQVAVSTVSTWYAARATNVGATGVSEQGA